MNLAQGVPKASYTTLALALGGQYSAGLFFRFKSRSGLVAAGTHRISETIVADVRQEELRQSMCKC